MKNNQSPGLRTGNNEYLRNEYTTNKIVAFFLLAFVLIAALNLWLLRWDQATGISYHVHNHLFVPINILLLVMVAIAWRCRFQKPWIKYMLLTGTVLVTTASFFAFTTFTVYVIFIPIFISTRYFDKRLIITISIITAALFAASCILNVELDAGSPVIRELHQSIAYSPWTCYPDALVIAAPSLLLMLFLAVFSVNMTTNGRKLIGEKIRNSQKIAAVNAEIGMAARIQKSVLPASRFRTPDERFELFAYESPAKEVCGDFYDYFMLNDHLLAVIVADVSDKGAPAAMFMMSAKKAIQCAVVSRNDLTEAIQLANWLICHDNQYGMFLTLWMGVIDTRSGVGKYVNAGHPYPLIKHRDGSVGNIENEPNLFIGNFPDKNPQVHTFRMLAGDTLYIYTDGLTDSVNPDGQSFGLDRLITQVRDSTAAPSEAGMACIAAAQQFSDGTVPFDDITLMTVQCHQTEEPAHISHEVESGVEGTAALNDEMQTVLRQWGCPDEKRRNIGVAVDEICNNIAEYAYENNGNIRLEATVGSNYAEMTFFDSGIPFNPLTAPAPNFTDTVSIGGLGIYFVKNLSDKLHYEYTDGQNRLTVLFIWNI